MVELEVHSVSAVCRETFCMECEIIVKYARLSEILVVILTCKTWIRSVGSVPGRGTMAGGHRVTIVG